MQEGVIKLVGLVMLTDLVLPPARGQTHRRVPGLHGPLAWACSTQLTAANQTLKVSRCR